VRKTVLIGLLTLATALAVPAWAKNYALLIGNSHYSIGALDNPANDANDLANTLRAIGFETMVKVNVDADGMKSLIRDFGNKLKNNDGIGLFFFAGHGLQVNGRNYLVPRGLAVSATVRRPNFSKSEDSTKKSLVSRFHFM